MRRSVCRASKRSNLVVERERGGSNLPRSRWSVPSDLKSLALFAVIFVVVGLARADVRVGERATLLTPLADDERPLYAAATNTVAGVLTFVFIAIGVFAQVVGIDAILGPLGVGAAWRMPEPDHMVTGE